MYGYHLSYTDIKSNHTDKVRSYNTSAQAIIVGMTVVLLIVEFYFLNYLVGKTADYLACNVNSPDLYLLWYYGLLE